MHPLTLDEQLHILHVLKWSDIGSQYSTLHEQRYMNRLHECRLPVRELINRVQVSLYVFL